MMESFFLLSAEQQDEALPQFKEFLRIFILFGQVSLSQKLLQLQLYKNKLEAKKITNNETYALLLCYIADIHCDLKQDEQRRSCAEKVVEILNSIKKYKNEIMVLYKYNMYNILARPKGKMNVEWAEKMLASAEADNTVLEIKYLATGTLGEAYFHTMRFVEAERLLAEFFKWLDSDPDKRVRTRAHPLLTAEIIKGFSHAYVMVLGMQYRFKVAEMAIQKLESMDHCLALHSRLFILSCRLKHSQFNKSEQEMLFRSFQMIHEQVLAYHIQTKADGRWLPKTFNHVFFYYCEKYSAKGKEVKQLIDRYKSQILPIFPDIPDLVETIDSAEKKIKIFSLKLSEAGQLMQEIASTFEGSSTFFQLMSKAMGEVQKTPKEAIKTLKRAMQSMLDDLETKFRSKETELELLAFLELHISNITRHEAFMNLHEETETALEYAEMVRAFGLYMSMKWSGIKELPSHREFSVAKDIVPLAMDTNSYFVITDLLSGIMMSYVVTPAGKVLHFMYQVGKFTREAPTAGASMSSMAAFVQTGRAIKKPSIAGAVGLTPSTALQLQAASSEDGMSWPAAPIIQHIPANSTVYIVPAGQLYNVPWNLLKNKTTNRFLCQDYTISIVPNLKFLEWARSRTSSVNTLRSAVRMGFMALGSNIPATVDEINRIQAQVDVRKYSLNIQAEYCIGEAATSKEHILNMIKRCHFLHLATHGDASVRNAEDRDFDTKGGLYCANHQPIYGSELEQAISESGHKVLFAFFNACEVATGEPTKTDSLMNICRHLFAAGVTGSIASLVPLQDSVAKNVADRFYMNLLQGQPSALALRNTLVYLLENKLATCLDLAGYLHMGYSFQFTPMPSGSCFYLASAAAEMKLLANKEAS